MKDKNFNQLKAVKAPEEWIQKAVNIPNKNNKSYLFPFFKPYVIGTAASVLVAVALGVIIYMTMGSGSRIPSSSLIPPTQSTDSSLSVTTNGDIYTTVGGDGETSPSQYNPNSNTFLHGFNPNFGREPSENTQKPTGNAGGAFIGPTEPTEGYSELPTRPWDNQNPTKPSYPNPTTGREPDETEVYPTEVPTEPCTYLPTEAPELTEPMEPEFTYYPTEPETPPRGTDAPFEPAPTDAPSYVYSKSIYIVSNNLFKNSKQVYCHITDSKTGKEYSTKYSANEKMNMFDRNYCYAEYNPYLMGISLPKNRLYNLHFYDGNRKKFTVYDVFLYDGDHTAFID